MHHPCHLTIHNWSCAQAPGALLYQLILALPFWLWKQLLITSTHAAAQVGIHDQRHLSRNRFKAGQAPGGGHLGASHAMWSVKGTTWAHAHLQASAHHLWLPVKKPVKQMGP